MVKLLAYILRGQIVYIRRGIMCMVFQSCSYGVMVRT